MHFWCCQANKSIQILIFLWAVKNCKLKFLAHVMLRHHLLRLSIHFCAAFFDYFPHAGHFLESPGVLHSEENASCVRKEFVGIKLPVHKESLLEN